MNYNLSILAAFIFLVAATAAERLSNWHTEDLRTQRSALNVTVNELSVRANQALAEEKKYHEAEAAAAEIKSKMTRQGDGTSLIQWFDTAAKNWGVVLFNAKLVPPDRAVEAGAYQRIRMEVSINGAYLGLLKYVESVERASIPMVIDSFTLKAGEVPGTGDLTLNISCLFPTPTGKSPRTGGMQ